MIGTNLNVKATTNPALSPVYNVLAEEYIFASGFEG